MLGTLNWRDSTMACYNIVSGKDDYGLINNRYNIGVGSFELPNQGNADNDFIKDMLADLRQTLVSSKAVVAKNGSHFTISRVMIQNSINNFNLEKIK